MLGGGGNTGGLPGPMMEPESIRQLMDSPFMQSLLSNTGTYHCSKRERQICH